MAITKNRRFQIKSVVSVVTQCRGAQISGARSPWRLLFVGTQSGGSFRPPEFWAGWYTLFFGKIRKPLVSSILKLFLAHSRLSTDHHIRGLNPRKPNALPSHSSYRGATPLIRTGHKYRVVCFQVPNHLSSWFKFSWNYSSNGLYVPPVATKTTPSTACSML